MKITTKRFVLSSELKNDKGFRVRTSGIDLAEFNINPIMLFMHERPKGKSRDEILPIGNIVELKIEDGKLTGRLAFDETDDFAIKLYQKVENGTLRMVSAGLIPLKWGKDANGDVWLELSKLKEISLVDIGSNAEAVAVALYNESDELVNLSLTDIQKILKPDNIMKLIELSALAVLPLLNLKADATAEEAQEAIGNLVTLAANQKNEIVTLTTERDDFKTKLDDAVTLAAQAKIITFLDTQEGLGKFVKGDRPKWEHLANKDFDGTKDLLEGMPSNKTVLEQLKREGTDEALLKLSYDELDQTNQLETLKAQNIEAFKEKFKTKFNKEYKEN